MKYYRLKANNGDTNSERNNQHAFEQDDLQPNGISLHSLTKTHSTQRLPKTIYMDGVQVEDVFFVPQSSNKKLILSEKLKMIFEKYSNSSVQYVPVDIHHSMAILQYWFLVPLKTDYNVLNFDKTIMSVVSEDGRKITRYTARSSGELQSIIESLKLPQRLRIDRPFFKNEWDGHLIILPNVDEGTGYYVSEQMKDEIEFAQCSGARFQVISL